MLKHLVLVTKTSALPSVSHLLQVKWFHLQFNSRDSTERFYGVSAYNVVDLSARLLSSADKFRY